MDLLKVYCEDNHIGQNIEVKRLWRGNYTVGFCLFFLELLHH